MGGAFGRRTDRLACAVTPGPFTGAHEDLGADGRPVWGCTWGTHDSYPDVREVTKSRFTSVRTSPDLTVTPLKGIGDEGSAFLAKGNNGTINSYVFFVVAGHYYEAEVTVDRRELDATNAPREVAAAQELSKTVAKRLAA